MRATRMMLLALLLAATTTRADKVAPAAAAPANSLYAVAMAEFERLQGEAPLIAGEADGDATKDTVDGDGAVDKELAAEEQEVNSAEGADDAPDDIATAAPARIRSRQELTQRLRRFEQQRMTAIYRAQQRERLRAVRGERGPGVAGAVTADSALSTVSGRHDAGEAGAVQLVADSRP